MDYAVGGGPGDAVCSGDLAETLPALAVSDDGFAIKIERPASDGSTFEAGAPHAGAHPFDDQVTFELGDGADDHHDGAAQRSAVSMFSRNDMNSIWSRFNSSRMSRKC